MIRIREIDHVVLRVVDLDGMIRFYAEVLGCSIERRQDEIGLVQLRAGSALVDLVPVDQKLYTQLNQGTFENPVSVGKDAESYRTSGAPESEIAFKITSLDAAGNESAGTIASIRLPKLAQTGAPFALLAFGSSFLLSGLRRLRKK